MSVPVGLPTLCAVVGTSGVEFELDAEMNRTGRWRRRQFYGTTATRLEWAKDRKVFPWREPPVRP